MEHLIALILMAGSGGSTLAGAPPAHQVPACIRLESGAATHAPAHGRCVVQPARPYHHGSHHSVRSHHDVRHHAPRPAAHHNSAPRYVSPHGRQPAPPLHQLVQFERTHVSHHSSQSEGWSRGWSGCDCDCPCGQTRTVARAEARAGVIANAAGFSGAFTGGVGHQPGYVIVHPYRTRAVDPRFNPPSAGRAIQRINRSSGHPAH